MSKFIFNWLAKIVTGEIVSTWVWPSCISIVITVMGYFDGIPLYYLSVGAVFLFAASATGLLRFSEWRYHNQVEHRLIFDGVIVQHVTNKDQNGMLYTAGIRLGIQVKNDALFPIQFKMDRMHTELNNWYPPKTKPNYQEIELPANSPGFHYDENISIVDRLDRGTQLGRIESCLKYGKPGNLKYKLKINQSVFCNFNEYGLFESHLYAQANNDLQVVKHD